jgi:hypothetical protein
MERIRFYTFEIFSYLLLDKIIILLVGSQVFFTAGLKIKSFYSENYI